ncbi:hypothetical protein [Synechocystis sp. LKSZ1]|uniref:hypothetical protein n=1 Tax=Synechocystis sp. LKSZ1 TaxID=3144951 RepID=UPI00336BF729
MLQAIANAIETEQYEEALQLLQDLEAADAENLWAIFYRARLTEAIGDLTEAEGQYRQLLPQVNNPQLTAKIRQGLTRISQQRHLAQAKAQQERQQALEAVRQEPENQQPGIFVLDIVPPEDKPAVAAQFAEIMQIDAYSARLQLPSRAWRLYRTGGLGELAFYQQQCEARGIPSFCVPVSQILALKVLPVFYLETLEPNPRVVYRINHEEQGQFDFQWSEVGQRVEGLLPIFEEYVNVNTRGKIERRTDVLDYAKICDLHLLNRNIILRFCDQVYEFHQGVSLLAPENRSQESTSHEQWQTLQQHFQDHLPLSPVWSDFNPFADTAKDFPELLKLITPHIHFLRREETLWDQAFHLYSSLAFCRRVGNCQAGLEPPG